MLRLLLSFACGSAVAVGLPSNHFKLADTHLRGGESFLRNQELRQENEQMHHIRRLGRRPVVIRTKPAEQQRNRVMGQRNRVMEEQRNRVMEEQLQHAISQREAADRALTPVYVERRTVMREEDLMRNKMQDAQHKERTANAAYKKAKETPKDAERSRSCRLGHLWVKCTEKKAKTAAKQAAEEARAAQEQFAAAELRHNEAAEKMKSLNVKFMLAADEEEIARIRAEGGVADRSNYYSEAEYLELYGELYGDHTIREWNSIWNPSTSRMEKGWTSTPTTKAYNESLWNPSTLHRNSSSSSSFS